MNDIAAKTLRWLVFSALLALVPVFYILFMRIIKGKAHDIGAVLGDGSLLLIGSSICVAAIGEVIGSSRRNRMLKIISSDATMVLLFLSIMVFSSVAESRISDHIDHHLLALFSTIVFLCGITSAGACVALSDLACSAS